MTDDDTASPGIVIVMGASGTGKTTVGRRLARSLGWRFLDGDELHDARSIAKMSSGRPLDEEDRAPWLERLAAWTEGVRAAGEPAVVACSALRRGHRDRLRRADVAFVHLVAPRELIEERLASRVAHFMPPTLLDSQLAILEPPGVDERAVTVDAALPAAEQVRQVRRLLGLAGLAGRRPEQVGDGAGSERSERMMQVGMVGLGRMGGNMARRLRAHGHEVVGFDVAADSGRDADSLDALVGRLASTRVVWLMLPAGEPTRDAVVRLAELLAADDLVVDGGNSRHVDDAANARLLAARGIRYVDAGISGGVHGLEGGYGVMVGGSDEDVHRIRPLLESLAPSPAGVVHAGAVGAGHLAKMVHNGIEYGIMQAYGEGWELLRASGVVDDPDAVFAAWQHGTVIRSWLLELLVRALEQDPGLSGVRGVANDSGEGRWAVQEAVELGVPVPVLSAALYARFASRQEESGAMQVVAALRDQFGGHGVVTAASAPVEGEA